MSESNIDLNMYKTFYTVAKCGGILKASQILYISQPAISISIKKLEDSLGVQLFKRNNKGVQLTDIGEKLLFFVETALNTLNMAEKRIKEDQHLINGEVRIGVPTHIGIFLVNDWIQEFRRIYPGVKFFIENKSTQDLLNMLQKKEIDIIIDSAPIYCVSQDIRVDKLQDFEMCFVASEKYKKLAQNSLNFQVLNKYPLLLPAKRTSIRSSLEETVKKENADVVLDPTIEVSTTEVMYDLVKRGIGIGYFAKMSVLNDLINNELYEIKVNALLPKTEICVAYILEFLTNANITFIKYLKKEIDKRNIRAKKELRIICTQQCNYNCSFCHKEGINTIINEKLNNEDIVKFYKFLNTNYGINQVHISGGEPFTRKDISDLVLMLKKENAKITITSNGYCIPNDNLLFDNIDKINISLHSLNLTDYESITKVKGSYNAVINNIKMLRTNYPLLNICINSTLTDKLFKTDENIIDLINFAKSLKADLKIIELFPTEFMNNVISLQTVVPILEREKFKVTSKLFRKTIYEKAGFNITLLKCTCSAINDYKNKARVCYENNDICMTMDGNLHPCWKSNDVVSIYDELIDKESDKLKEKLEYFFEIIGNNCKGEKYE